MSSNPAPELNIEDIQPVFKDMNAYSQRWKDWNNRVPDAKHPLVCTSCSALIYYCQCEKGPTYEQ